MKSRNLFLILLAIFAVVIFVISIIPSEGEHGNELTMNYLAESNENINKKLHVIIELENSVSMKGFARRDRKIDYSNWNFTRNIKHLMTNMENDPYVSTVSWACGNRSGNNYESLNTNGIENGDIFGVGQGNSELQNYIERIGTGANDTTVTMFVSDMVYSLNNLGADKFKIKSQLGNFQADIINAMQKIKKNKIDLLLLQYTADCNGDYYYNCQNQNTYRGQTLEKRPYYVLVFGTKDNLNYFITKLPDCENIWATYSFDASNMREQDVKTFPDNRWANYDPDATKSEFTLWSQEDWEDQTSNVEFEFSAIKLPKFLEEWTPECNSNAVTSVTRLSDSRIKIEFNRFDQLADEENVRVSFISERSPWDDCSIDDDITDDIQSLEGKTWAFSYLMEAIAEEYPAIGENVEVGNFNFILMKY